jgi:hypothetical protein
MDRDASLEHLERQTARIDDLNRQLAKLRDQVEQLQRERVGEGLRRLEHAAGYVDRGTQLLMALKYRELAARGERLSFNEVEFRNHSQNGEDGILWYIFSLIGATRRMCVELCAGNGIECNSANLIVNHGWLGLLCDGSAENIATGREFYANHPNTWSLPPNLQQQWINAENVNQLIESNGFAGEIDLLSIDIDGIDYWLWKAIEVCSPRVVMLEINASWGCEASVTVPYDPAFEARRIFDQGRLVAYYCGASLPAFVKLARAKGYRLVGSNSYDFNVVFMRNDVGVELFPEVTAESCFDHPCAHYGHAMARPYIADLDWQEV